MSRFIVTAILSLSFFVSPFVTCAQEAAAEGDAFESQLGEGALVAPPAQNRKPPRGLRLTGDGLVIGHVVFVEPNSLSLTPVPNAIVSFMQNMKFVAQTKTDADGRFIVANLTPLATYSMFVSSDAWVSASGTYILPFEKEDEQSASNSANRLLFVSRIDNVAFADDGPDAENLIGAQVVQAMPRSDMMAVLQQDVFNTGAGPAPMTAINQPGTGGGGGGGAGSGAAVGAAAAGALIGGAIGAAVDERSASETNTGG